ncbi:PEBP-like protein [Massarina eburnea CBS 473.64]|uniref:PEBP-like protein n=1 Tax=Massarina eburnea CBS 473.64 TaxID=1395130 RepID=A0A6A6RP52_9PLEO|nr:PEBP-like protein [Massarina eburnea CBS 473.64]
MYLHASIALVSLQLLQLGGYTSALPTEQKPLRYTKSDNVQAVRDELKKAEIIPTVIDDFLPSLTLSVSWDKKTASLGNTIKPKHLQDAPTITLHDSTDSDVSTTSNITYVITLTDPDAPSRDNPEWSEFCHWIGANVSLTEKTYSILPLPIFGFQESDTDDEEERKTGLDTVVEYKPPGPPAKTGKHRYVFLVFGPKNGTTEKLFLSTPEERKHWGTGEERGGVKIWAEKNGLVPVAANFLYAQNEKQ